MINSVYGKTMKIYEKNQCQTSKQQQQKNLEYTSRPTHIPHKIFGKSYAAVHEIKPDLLLNKPIYVGFTVLELRKW